ncbi:MAG: GNAT family N-acetyltransferase [Bdellovibrionales bacterium]|nr:GNAT family N-acetyltransferase [Bdellovibrionales bacterium]
MKKPKSTDVEETILEKLKMPSTNRRQSRPLEPIGEAIANDLLMADLKRCELMLDTSEDRPEKGLCVYRAKGADIPNLLLELGRLREETFRTVGEGTGLARDIDSFDQYYDQFIGWDKSKGEITGAYRIGRVDQILKEKGAAGVYTNTLFHLESLFDSDFKTGTLEAGRSFVRPEYQRGLTLLVIWMALARFIVKNPQYKYLMGPVSISDEFQENSKHLMVSYLMKYHPHEKSNLVQSKNPPTFDSNLSPEELTALVDASLNLQSLQEFVRHAEGRPRAQIPQLIKLYLELGVRFLAFNKDDDFNSIDGLIWLDIPNIPPDLLKRYFGEDGWQSYSRYHGKL